MKARMAPDGTRTSKTAVAQGAGHPMAAASNAMLADTAEPATRGPSLLASFAQAEPEQAPHAFPVFVHDEGGVSERGPTTVVTTGRDANGNVVSLPLTGDYDQSNFLPHHADRSNSWAARQTHNEHNPVGEVNSWDFTFNEVGPDGQPTNIHLGVPLIAPGDARVLDVQTEYEGSGGLGRYIVLEFTEGEMAGKRIRIHHLDTVNAYEEGAVVPGGTVVGTQGNSGNDRFSYSEAYSHVDAVGTPEAIHYFVQANHTGAYDSNIAGERDTFAPMQIGHRGSNVTAMQQMLVDQGVLETADGDYGPNTQAAVRQFQTTHGLPPSGYVDRATWEAMQPQEEAGLQPVQPSPERPKQPPISFVG